MANEFKAKNGVITPTVQSTVTTGTAPFAVASTTAVINLNADLLDGQEGSYYLALGNASGTLAIGNGGTGQTTANAALNALLPSQTGNNGKFLTTNGTDSSWADAGGGSSTFIARHTFTATASQTTFTISGGYTASEVDVFLNGVKLLNGTDVTVTSGTDVVLATGATVGDILEVLVYTTFSVAGAYTKGEADSKFVDVAGDTMTGDLTFSGDGRRIYAPMGEGTTVADNLTFIPTETNADARLQIAPSGSGGSSSLRSYAQNDMENSAYGFFYCSTTGAIFGANKTGSATAPNIRVQTGAATRLTIESDGTTTWAQAVGHADGTVSAPGITFSDDTNTGIYRSGADTINVAAGGANKVIIDTDGLEILSGRLKITNPAGAWSYLEETSESITDGGLYAWGSYLTNVHLVKNTAAGGDFSASTTLLTINKSGDLTMAGNVSAYSDVRLKKDFVQIDHAIDKVSQLNGFTFTRTDTNERQTGLIAQEVQKVLPEAVIEGEYLSVAYGNLVGLLVEAIKELKAEIDELKGK